MCILVISSECVLVFRMRRQLEIAEEMVWARGGEPIRVMSIVPEDSGFSQ